MVENSECSWVKPYSKLPHYLEYILHDTKEIAEHVDLPFLYRGRFGDSFEYVSLDDSVFKIKFEDQRKEKILQNVPYMQMLKRVGFAYVSSYFPVSFPYSNPKKPIIITMATHFTDKDRMDGLIIKSMIDPNTHKIMNEPTFFKVTANGVLLPVDKETLKMDKEKKNNGATDQ